jgi:WD40 repeat protein
MQFHFPKIKCFS